MVRVDRRGRLRRRFLSSGWLTGRIFRRRLTVGRGILVRIRAPEPYAVENEL